MRLIPGETGAAAADPREGAQRRPRLAFLGLGWIGRARMQAIAASGAADIVALADPAEEALEAAAAEAPQARRCAGLDELLSLRPDGIVIATPSAQHADQALAALAAGVAVFCQKPLGRTAEEAAAVVAAAQSADRLLAVDFSYRHTAAGQALRREVRQGTLGHVFSADLVFHNAYGPDKPWFYDARLSGGGCVMDLGVHLVDLALWLLDFPGVSRVHSHLYAKGAQLASRGEVEDFALATLELATGAAVRIACSWNLHAGRDAEIRAELHGTQGGAAFWNENGSFFDFAACRRSGTSAQMLCTPPDDWGGRAAAQWAERLAGGARFDPAAHELVKVAQVIDRIYGDLPQ